MNKGLGSQTKKFTLKPIRTNRDYELALKRVDEIFDAKRNTPEGNELEILAFLIEKYEDELYPIGLPDPIEAIKFRLEQLSYGPKDLEKIMGFTSGRVSEILNKRRKLSIEMIRKFHSKLNIPTDVLIQAY